MVARIRCTVTASIREITSVLRIKNDSRRTYVYDCWIPFAYCDEVFVCESLCSVAIHRSEDLIYSLLWLASVNGRKANTISAHLCRCVIGFL